jgi:hypothetical protein
MTNHHCLRVGHHNYDTPFGAISEAKQAALTGQTCKGYMKIMYNLDVVTKT